MHSSPYALCNYMSCASLRSESKTLTAKLWMTAACCVYECVGKAVIKDLMEREIILHLLCGSIAISRVFPPFLAVGFPPSEVTTAEPLWQGVHLGAVRGAGSIPGRSASVKGWQSFLQFPFPWATRSNQIQSSPHYLPLVSLIVIWKYVAKESKNRG